MLPPFLKGVYLMDTLPKTSTVGAREKDPARFES